MPAKVKICGLDREEAVDATVEAGAAMAGFVFYEPSERLIGECLNQRALCSQTPPCAR